MSSHPQRSRYRAAVGLASALVVAARVWAQAPPAPGQPWPIPVAAAVPAEPNVEDKRYDLPALIDLAERTNPETQIAWEEARQAADAVGLVEATYLPQISLQAIAGIEHTPLPAPKDLVAKGYFVSNTREVIPTIAVKWLLFDFGRRKALLQEARSDSFVANVSFTAAHQKIVFTVTQAYFSVGAARGQLRAARKALSTALTTQEAALTKQTSGLATVVAVAQAQRQTAQARYTVASAQGNERTALANLVTALGVRAGTELAIADCSELPLPAEPQQSVAAAVSQGLMHQPQVFAALGKIDAAEAALQAEKRSYYPTIEMGGHAFQNIGQLSSDGKPYSTIDKPGGNILFSLSVPIFDGGTRATRVSIARSRLHEAEDQLDKARDSTAQQVVKAYNSLITSLAQSDTALTLSQAAHTSYDAAMRAYQQGVGTYTDLVTEEYAVVQADTQIEDAHANAHTAAAALAFAIGAIEQ